MWFNHGKVKFRYDDQWWIKYWKSTTECVLLGWLLHVYVHHSSNILKCQYNREKEYHLVNL